MCIAVLLAACTPDSAGPSPTIALTTTTSSAAPGSTSTTIPAPDAVERFRLCLEELGIDIDPVPATADSRPRLDLVTRDLDFTDVSVAEAVTECSVNLGTGALDLATDELLREVVLSQLGFFSRCVRARGVPEFPDPIAGFNGVGAPFPVADIPYSNPALADAVAACQTSVLRDLPGILEDS